MLRATSARHMLLWRSALRPRLPSSHSITKPSCAKLTRNTSRRAQLRPAFPVSGLHDQHRNFRGKFGQNVNGSRRAQANLRGGTWHQACRSRVRFGPRLHRLAHRGKRNCRILAREEMPATGPHKSWHRTSHSLRPGQPSSEELGDNVPMPALQGKNETARIPVRPT